MRKLTTTLIALLISISAFAQLESPSPRNEIRLNLATTMLVFYPEVFYERVISQDFGLGASLGFATTENDWMNFNFTPFFRWYFGGRSQTARPASGFFIETSASLFSLNSWREGGLFSGSDMPPGYPPYYGVIYSRNSDLTTGIGLAIGWKYLTNSNWVGELLFGVTRDFSENNRYFNNNNHSRFAISIGRRF